MALLIQDAWLSGYAFWRGQYAVRNQRYKEMVSALNKRQLEVARGCGKDYILQNMVLWGVNEDPFVYQQKIEKRKPVNFDDILDFKSQKIALDREFPYVSLEIDPLKILRVICEGKFPPNYEKFIETMMLKDSENFSEEMILPVGARKKAVYYRGIDRHGLDVFAIDSNAELGAIVAEVKRCIDHLRSKENISMINKLDAVVHSGDIVSLKDELRMSGSAYRGNSDESRAVGLLMFDYLKSNDDSDAGAYRWVKNEIAEHGPKNFSKAKSGERQYQRWLANTRLCIDSAEVLEI